MKIETKLPEGTVLYAAVFPYCINENIVFQPLRSGKVRNGECHFKWGDPWPGSPIYTSKAEGAKEACREIQKAREHIKEERDEFLEKLDEYELSLEEIIKEEAQNEKRN